MKNRILAAIRYHLFLGLASIAVVACLGLGYEGGAFFQTAYADDTFRQDDDVLSMKAETISMNRGYPNSFALNSMRSYYQERYGYEKVGISGLHTSLPDLNNRFFFRRATSDSGENRVLEDFARPAGLDMRLYGKGEGKEDVNHIRGPVSPSEPATMLLCGIFLAGSAGVILRKRKKDLH